VGKTTIKRVGVLSAGKIMGALCAIIGVIIAAMLLLVSVLSVVIGSIFSGGSWSGVLLGGGITVFFAVFILVVYTVMGFVIGCLYALIYNLVAKYTGGLEVET